MVYNCFPRRFQRQLDDGRIRIHNTGAHTRSGNHLDVGKALRIQVRAELTHDLLEVLVRHQAKIELASSFSRDNGLGPFALVATPEAIDGAGGQEHRFLQGPAAQISSKAGDPMRGLLLVLFRGERDQQFALSLGGWTHPVVKSGNQYPLLLIFQGTQRPDQTPGGVGSMTRHPRMGILLHRLQP